MKVLLFLSIEAFSFFMVTIPRDKFLGNVATYSPQSNTTEKTMAFEILTNKCNICHVNRNRKKIFTLENMDLLGSEIHTQVFVKRRMPKGKKITLTDADTTILKNWLETLNIN